VTAAVPVGVGPFGAELSPNGNHAYIADLGPGNLSVLDTRTHQVAATASLGSFGVDPFSAHQAPTPWPSSTHAHSKVLTTIPVGDSPYGVAADPTTGG
jgi:YVTN family beta-propeller protein